MNGIGISRMNRQYIHMIENKKCFILFKKQNH